MQAIVFELVDDETWIMLLIRPEHRTTVTTASDHQLKDFTSIIVQLKTITYKNQDGLKLGL